jgi:chromosomal replication initiator protein
VVESLIEIPFPGRTIAAPAAAALGRTPAATLPSFVAGPENVVVASVIGGLRTILPNDSDLESGDVESRSAAPAVISLYGPSGVGKSHLLRGLVEHWQHARGIETAEYVTAGDFRRDFLEAMHDDRVTEFRDRIRSRQLLAIDDLDRLPSDPYLMEELRNTLDDCEASGGQVLVASLRSAGSLANLSTDVRGRLAAGLALQLAAPGAAARARIVSQAAAVLGRTVSEEGARRLAGGVAETANELFGALFELLATFPAPAPIDREQVQRYLSTRAARRTSLREVIAVVARYYGLPQKLVKSGSRKHAAVVARATIVYLARELADASYEQIGQALGGRDHSTIMHSFRTMDRDRQRDWQTQETLTELHRILQSR